MLQQPLACLGPTVDAVSPALRCEPNTLILKGDYWLVRYIGKSALLEDCRGLRYIALLVQRASSDDGPLQACELVALANGEQCGSMELTTREPVVDSRAEQQMIKRLEEIAFERNAANLREDYKCLALLDEEVERISDELSRARHSGRLATFSDAGERARKAVAKAITDAISKLNALPDMKPLAKHLSTAVQKGRWLSYVSSGVEWQVEFRTTSSAKKNRLRPAM